MSTDTIYQQLRSHLAYLKLTAAADALAPALEAAEREKPGYTRFLNDLLAAEVAATEQRRLDGRLRFAKLPAHKRSSSSTSTPNPHSTAGSSRTSRRCGSSKRRPTSC